MRVHYLTILLCLTHCPAAFAQNAEESSAKQDPLTGQTAPTADAVNMPPKPEIPELSAERSTDVQASDGQVGQNFDAEREPTKRKRPMAPSRLTVWLLAGLSGAAAITGGVFGLTALDEEERFAAHPDPEFADRGAARAVAADVSFAVAGAAAIGALLVWLIADDEQSGPSQLSQFELKDGKYRQ